MNPTTVPDVSLPPSRLTIGLVVASGSAPAWLADIITAVVEAGDAEVVDVMTSGISDTANGNYVGRALLGAYGWVDGLVFGQPDDPTRTVQLGPARAAARSRATSRVEKVDIVLRLDGGDTAARWPAPALGVWTLEHGMGLPRSTRQTRLGLAPGGAELLLGRSFTISQLVATVGTDRRVIGQVVSRVDRLSLRRGARGHTVKLPSLVARTISMVRADCALPEAAFESHVDEADDDRPASLGVAAISLGLFRVVTSYVRGLIRRKVAPLRWVVAVAPGSREPRAGDGLEFRFLEPPDGSHWADPFPLDTPQGEFMFVEEYVRTSRRGRLAVVELDESDRGWRSVETILSLPSHLSYPFVFPFADQWYLLPEQAGTGKLELYVAEEFPVSWRWHSTALDRPASDATLAEIDGRWWMFTAIRPKGGNAADELHVFHATTPLGPWTAHAHNPVVSDIRYSRAAGRLYREDGAWYRVAQDGAVSYGHSIAIIRIDRIDPDTYRESVVDVIRPDWAPGLMATHTSTGQLGSPWSTRFEANRASVCRSIDRRPGSLNATHVETRSLTRLALTPTGVLMHRRTGNVPSVGTFGRRSGYRGSSSPAQDGGRYQ